jgi:hypothetical protein
VSLERRVVVASFSVLCNGIGGRPSSEKSGRGSSPNRWKNLLSSFFSNRKSTKWVAVAALGSTRERERIVLESLGQGLGVDHTFLGGIHVRKGRLECVGQVSVLE